MYNTEVPHVSQYTKDEYNTIMGQNAVYEDKNLAICKLYKI